MASLYIKSANHKKPTIESTKNYKKQKIVSAKLNKIKAIKIL
uniref:Uncharacterized protein n=1 Tax=Bartonella schoenbuchensis (strain DSM 13525 / NCTC 13165 / R1) TaxID=687861 RepID=E6YZ57_BARSR|nr:hypothetical protein B11C_30001 [Bartonella schoenbuchensis R1]